MKDHFFVHEKVKEYIRLYTPKIAIIAPSLDTIPSRQGNAIYCLIEDIAYYSKFPVLVFSVFGRDLPKSKIDDRIIYYLKPLKKTFFQKKMGHRLRVKFYGISRTEDIEYARQVYDYCIKNKIRCLMVEDSNSLLAGLLFDSKIKILLHQHASSLLGHTNYTFEKLTGMLSEIVFVSKKSKDDVCAKFNITSRKMGYIYNGIELSSFKVLSKKEFQLHRGKLNIENTDRVLFFASRIHKDKGIKELLESIEYLKFKVRLLIAGDLKTSFDYNPEFEKTISRINPANVIFLGNIKQEELANYYGICDFLIVPSTGKEGLPKVVTEALVMGKPVIASDRGGIRELVKNGSNGVIIEDPVCASSISKAINVAFNHHESLAENALMAREKNRIKFSAENMADQFDSIFSKYLHL